MTPTLAQPELSVLIQIRFSEKNEMYAVLRSLIPDNINFPMGLSMEISPREKEKELLLRIHCNIGFETLLNTLDELLEHVSIAQKVISHA
ncbi:MAG TPA: KEOPS complex subunit Pcc1 [Candidatus Bathyarchaeia archaeon]|nr:KEOPS complex subunit Pcc1 [Candidatus Bathyarchaeia archaeon]